MEIFFRDQQHIVYEIRLIAIREVSPPFGEEHRGLEQDISFFQLTNIYLFWGSVTLSTSTHRHYNESVHRKKQHTRGINTIP